MGRALFCELVALASSLACASEPKLVAPRLPAHYERLGSTTGEGCGTLVLNVIPILMDTRVERAYASALARTPGATALVSVDLSETWYWWLVGAFHCTMLDGIAIREIAQPAASNAPQATSP